MAKAKGRAADTQASAPVAPRSGPRSAVIATKGIRTAGDFAKMMSAMMSDLIEGNITPAVGNAACNAGGKLLKVVEMQYKYGVAGDGAKNTRSLLLTIEDE